MSVRLFAAISAVLLCLSALPARALVLEQAEFTDLSGWQDDSNLRAGFKAFRTSCTKFAASRIYPSSAAGMKGNIAKACTASLVFADDTDGNGIREFFKTYFTPYRTKGDAFFTGYYEIALNGSRIRTGNFIYPIYAAPRDLKPGTPYRTRAEINRGALEGQGLEIAYTDDPVQLFFLHVQGSGRLQLPDGETMMLGFAAKNQQPYTSIGKNLVDTGEIKTPASAQKVMEWLRAHPDRMQAVFEQNASYIFFKEMQGSGPVGALGVALTPEGSLAVDKKHIPLGTPLWVSTEWQHESVRTPINRLLVAQDTGSAIVGEARGDIFFGAGEHAERMAGAMQNKGTLYLLLPKP